MANWHFWSDHAVRHSKREITETKAVYTMHDVWTLAGLAANTTTGLDTEQIFFYLKAIVTPNYINVRIFSLTKLYRKLIINQDKAEINKISLHRGV